MTAARFYSSTSGVMELQADISAASSTMQVDTVTGLPGTTPFTLVIEPGVSASEEIVTVTNVGGTTLTITRGVDGSSATAHSAGSEIRHMATARDYREAQEHIGASVNVHGLGGSSSVVGTTDTQVLNNKTLQAPSAAVIGAVVKGATSQSAAYLDVQDSAGVSVATVKPGEGTVTVGTVLVNNTGPAGLFGYVLKAAASAAAVVPAIFKAAASQTGDLLQLQDSAGATLAKFDKDGKLTAPQVTSTGPVSGTTGTFSGAITSTTTTAIDGRVTAIETNLGSQTAFAATSSTKDGKKLHWGTISGTTDASAFLTVTHGAGFTPTVVVLTGGNALQQVQVDSLGATTFRLRVTDSAGNLSASATYNGFFICGE